MATVAWNPRKHPRNLLGRFREVIAGLPDGDSAQLPDGTKVTRRRASYVVRGRGRGRRSSEVAAEPVQAARAALDASARRTSPRSVGGTRSLNNHEEAEALARLPRLTATSAGRQHRIARAARREAERTGDAARLRRAREEERVAELGVLQALPGAASPGRSAIRVKVGPNTLGRLKDAIFEVYLDPVGGEEEQRSEEPAASGLMDRLHAYERGRDVPEGGAFDFSEGDLAIVVDALAELRDPYGEAPDEFEERWSERLRRVRGADSPGRPAEVSVPIGRDGSRFIFPRRPADTEGRRRRATRERGLPAQVRHGARELGHVYARNPDGSLRRVASPGRESDDYDLPTGHLADPRTGRELLLAASAAYERLDVPEAKRLARAGKLRLDAELGKGKAGWSLSGAALEPPPDQRADHPNAPPPPRVPRAVTEALGRTNTPAYERKAATLRRLRAKPWRYSSAPSRINVGEGEALMSDDGRWRGNRYWQIKSPDALGPRAKGEPRTVDSLTGMVREWGESLAEARPVELSEPVFDEAKRSHLRVVSGVDIAVVADYAGHVERVLGPGEWRALPSSRKPLLYVQGGRVTAVLMPVALHLHPLGELLRRAAEAREPSGSDGASPLAGLTRDQLRGLLHANGQAVNGPKATLIQRAQAAGLEALGERERAAGGEGAYAARSPGRPGLGPHGTVLHSEFRASRGNRDSEKPWIVTARTENGVRHQYFRSEAEANEAAGLTGGSRERRSLRAGLVASSPGRPSATRRALIRSGERQEGRRRVAERRAREALGREVAPMPAPQGPEEFRLWRLAHAAAILGADRGLARRARTGELTPRDRDRLAELMGPYDQHTYEDSPWTAGWNAARTIADLLFGAP